MYKLEGKRNCCTDRALALWVSLTSKSECLLIVEIV
jgi:hypothetical protein